jgi:hypothetical protein
MICDTLCLFLFFFSANTIWMNERLWREKQKSPNKRSFRRSKSIESSKVQIVPRCLLRKTLPVGSSYWKGSIGKPHWFFPTSIPSFLGIIISVNFDFPNHMSSQSRRRHGQFQKLLDQLSFGTIPTWWKFACGCRVFRIERDDEVVALQKSTHVDRLHLDVSGLTSIEGCSTMEAYLKSSKSLRELMIHNTNVATSQKQNSWPKLPIDY